jgi:NADH-quinone oxidoreductase subunit G
MTSAVPFYTGIDLEAIGGTGVRWQTAGAADKLPAAELPTGHLASPPELPEGLRLGLTHSIWADPVTEHAPSLRFLAPEQRAELAPSDAKRIGVQSGDRVEVAVDGASVQATVALRQGIQPGSVFLLAGTLRDNATALANGSPRVVDVRRIESEQRSPLAVVAAGGPDAEPPPS